MTINHQIPSVTTLHSQGILSFAQSLTRWIENCGLACAVYRDAPGSSDLVGGRRPAKVDITKETYTFPIEIEEETSEVLSSLRLLVLGSVDERLDSAINALVQEAFGLALRAERLEKPAMKHKWGMVAITKSSVALFDQIAKIAPQPNPVLILGETGTGKERVASALHMASGRKGKFIAINCGGLSESLLEDELFGHVKGSFTGANENKVGAFEAASGGTIFLDEIGEMTERVQVALLRVLQEQKIRRVGESIERAVDVRMVFATHRNLPEMVAAKSFRSDLFFRVKRLVVNISPLRERPEEILPMAEYFLGQLSQRTCKKFELSTDARKSLIGHRWPGNVRELVNIVEDASAICEDGIIRASDLETLGISLLAGECVRLGSVVSSLSQSTTPGVDLPVELKAATYNDFSLIVEKMERDFLRSVLQSHNGNKSKAAAQLGVRYSTLGDRLRKLGFNKEVVFAA